MREYLKGFMEKYSYPEEAEVFLLGAFDRIVADGGRQDALAGILQRYEADMRQEHRPFLDEMAAIAEKAGVHKYTSHLLLQILMSRHLLECYRGAGIDEQIWHTTMNDLKWKMLECRDVYGIWGTFVADWQARFFKMDRFGFLKLQFEASALGHPYERDGVTLVPGVPVINTHLPRTGEKLDKESMDRSFALAADFFRERYSIDPPIFVCNSWLLYPDNLKVLSPDSNLYDFISRFGIVKSWESEDYSEAWRLFAMEYKGDVDALPQDTSLRRTYADWIRRGKKFGAAEGVYLYRENGRLRQEQ